jgi:hypothetical protein
MCLNIGHMQKLACLYGCVLQKEATLVHQDRAPGQMFPTAPPDANPHAHLAQLEARVATRQAQHTGLTLQLLRECTAQCLLALEAERTGGDHRSQVLRPLCYLRKP